MCRRFLYSFPLSNTMLSRTELCLAAFCNNKFFQVVIVSHTLQTHVKYEIGITETKQTFSSALDICVSLSLS